MMRLSLEKHGIVVERDVGHSVHGVPVARLQVRRGERVVRRQLAVLRPRVGRTVGQYAFNRTLIRYNVREQQTKNKALKRINI